MHRLEGFWLGVVEIDDAGVVRSVNGATAQALGPEALPAVGEAIDVDAAWYVAAEANAGHDHTWVRAHPVRHQLADGSLRWLRVQAVPGLVDGRSIVIEDVTDEEDARRELEGAASIRSQLVAELDEANAQLARTNAELRRFAGAIAHDLKGPLANILGFTRALPELVGEVTPDAAEVIARLERNARRSNEMISDLLAYARAAGSSTDHEMVALGAVVAWALEVQRGALDEAAAEVEVGELPMVLGNEAALRQVFLNLVDNAVKYRRPDEPLRLQIRHVASADPELAEIQVVDNGRGIPRAKWRHVFDLGVRLDQADVPGTGIGLASCAAVLGSLGGFISIGPTDDELGTCFVLGIPVAEVLDESLAPMEGTLMVIDDDADVIHIVRLLADTIGLRVIATARGAEAALTTFADLDEPVDVVVLDLALADGDGLDVARAMLARQPDLRIVVHSGLVDDAQAEAARAAGVAEVVGKTADHQDELLAALRRLVGSR